MPPKRTSSQKPRARKAKKVCEEEDANDGFYIDGKECITANPLVKLQQELEWIAISATAIQLHYNKFKWKMSDSSIPRDEVVKACQGICVDLFSVFKKALILSEKYEDTVVVKQLRELSRDAVELDQPIRRFKKYAETQDEDFEKESIHDFKTILDAFMFRVNIIRRHISRDYWFLKPRPRLY
ncbi:uncharacterized protein CXQ87_001971 [Candidozyma duobushaemuli]|uniref:Uncharacterized protein n=1 Tax=Candidozyma duobushaemuli TaxID=1231522 RepID=A0A2V1A9C8_9ASCO|nr:uncharacterized protein CXQ87_001971 [[Candida] duobushaemulonis]PVH13853.1 hypothetical protein CXQ87_001971 [[Candida] duobushaemulonis]